MSSDSSLPPPPGAGPPTIVLDTSVIISAALGREGSVNAKVITAVEEGQVRLVTSRAWFEEVTAVLARPKIAGKITPERLERLRSVLLTGEPTHAPATLEWPLRDPNDWFLLDLAYDAGADFIVSRDKDLLMDGPNLGFDVLDQPGLLRLLRRRKDLSEG